MIPALQDLPEDLQKVVGNSNPNMLMAVAKGIAPLPPRVQLEALVFLKHGQDAALAQSASDSLSKYPEKILLGVIQGEASPWVLADVAQIFRANEVILEAVLLNFSTPDEVFVEAARTCSEKLTNLIVNNQERIIQAPQIIPALESNKKSLKSNTDRLRHFLKLAGIFIPGDKVEVVEEKSIDLSKVDAGDEPAENPDAQIEAALKATSNLNESERLNLLKYISTLNVGGKMKLAMKGNKEARQILIRDVNAIVSTAVLRSPRINDNEIATYARLRNVCDDVIRTIATSAVWTKNYDIKLAITLHPKQPIQTGMGFIKFLNLRDLVKVSKDRNIPTPIKKAAKQLLDIKRK